MSFEHIFITCELELELFSHPSGEKKPSEEPRWDLRTAVEILMVKADRINISTTSVEEIAEISEVYLAGIDISSYRNHSYLIFLEMSEIWLVNSDIDGNS